MTNPNPLAGQQPTIISRPRAQFLYFVLPIVAVLAFSLIATWRLHQNAQQNALQALQTQFDFRSHTISNEIVKRMGTYEQVLRGVDGLFAGSKQVERDEFCDYITRLHLKENYPGIQGIRFSPIVPFAEKERHIAAIRKQNLPSYSIHPEGRRDFYAPVIYIEPSDKRNQIIFGYDTYSDLEHPKPGDLAPGPRRAAMERARDTGSAALSGKIQLLFETAKDVQAGFLMFLPVYRHDAPRDTIEERRANIIGWVSMVFRADDLMRGVLGPGEVDVDIDLYDGSGAQDKFLLHDADNSASFRSSMPKALFEATQQINIGGHTWTLVTRSLPAFENRLDKEKPQLIAIGGITASLMLTLLAWLLLHDRERTLRWAAAIERESHKNKTLLHTAADGIYLADMNGNLLQVNEALCNMLGYPESALLKMNVAELCASYSKDELLANFARLGSTNPPFEAKHRLRDGSIIDVEISASKAEIDGQQVIYNSVRDITERKQAEQEITESRSRLNTLFENAMDAVVIIDSEGSITGWNSQAENIFGWTRTEAIGLALHLTIIPHQYREAHLHGVRRFLESGEGPLLNSRVEISALHRDGHEFPIELSVTPIKIRDKSLVSARF